MSHTLEITIPDDLYQTLTQNAQQTGQPIEAIASKWLSVAAEKLVLDPLESCIGAIDSGGSDWANEYNTYLGHHAADANVPV